MGSVIKRAGWILLAILFVGSGLGVGLLAFWQSTHPANPTSTNSAANSPPVCSSNTNLQINTEPTTGKLAGAKLSDFTPLAHIASLSCVDIKVGSSGQAVQSSSTVTANYTGALAKTGVIFQSSLDNNGQPFTAALSGVIPGWQQGLLGMRAGGERRLYIPASLAYGSQAQSGIPANSDLVFDISVIVVQ